MSDFDEEPTVTIPRQTMRELVSGQPVTPWYSLPEFIEAEREERVAQFDADVLAQQIATCVAHSVQPPREVVESYKRARARRDEAQKRITRIMDACGVERAA